MKAWTGEQAEQYEFGMELPPEKRKMLLNLEKMLQEKGVTAEDVSEHELYNFVLGHENREEFAEHVERLEAALDGTGNLELDELRPEEFIDAEQFDALLDQFFDFDNDVTDNAPNSNICVNNEPQLLTRKPTAEISRTATATSNSQRSVRSDDQLQKTGSRKGGSSENRKNRLHRAGSARSRGS